MKTESFVEGKASAAVSGEQPSAHPFPWRMCRLESYAFAVDADGEQCLENVTTPEERETMCALVKATEAAAELQRLRVAIVALRRRMLLPNLPAEDETELLLELYRMVPRDAVHEATAQDYAGKPTVEAAPPKFTIHEAAGDQEINAREGEQMGGA